MNLSSSPIQTIALPYRANSYDYFSRIHDLPWAVWLDSGTSSCEASPHARFDILSADPQQRIVVDSHGACHVQSNQGSCSQPNLWEALRQQLPLEHETHTDIPFVGGAIGYIGYDIGRSAEGLQNTTPSDMNLPQAQLGVYLWAIIQDHHNQESYLMVRSEVPEEQTQTLLHRVNTTNHEANTLEPFECPGFQPDLPPEQYAQHFDRIQHYIHAGDCYQVNFAQRFTAPFKGSSLAAYLALRAALPSPFSCYFATEHGAVLSVSPERFIQSQQRQIVTQPIKGTIRRGRHSQEDIALQKQLLSSRKDQAENLMIVDLLRNDLSKVCVPYSVRTPKLFDLESYANVHHLVSTVTGTLQEQYTSIDALEACFPGGSITGAPKIRSMEIIEELENTRRSVYCGSIGYIGFDGKMDTNIAIRTAAIHNKHVHVWGGGGIVADSESEPEFQESLTKVRLILETLTNFTAPARDTSN